MKKIGMVVAMQSEVESFLSARDLSVKHTKNGGFDIISFNIGKNQIICVQSGVGEIYAAAATQMLISVYGVDAVINFGVCGSLIDDIVVGEVVLVEGVIHYDFDTSAIDDCEVGRYMQYPELTLRPDEGLINLVVGLFPAITKVTCASADKFVADESKKDYLNRKFGTAVCEMESAGVLLTCINANVPCLIVKAVSDGKGGAEEFKEMVRHASEQYVDLIYRLSAII
ncbi:MAG: 5'-methylthioadenosine/S-adenosylhomocysteine nucleosidase [Clostridiales bacterium]|nr:5'-methylthioadenosine/S-adenosylhomocysteine nucleosidase [Clostridiales bacterium]